MITKLLLLELRCDLIIFTEVRRRLELHSVFNSMSVKNICSHLICHMKFKAMSTLQYARLAPNGSGLMGTNPY